MLSEHYVLAQCAVARDFFARPIVDIREGSQRVDIRRVIYDWPAEE